MTKIRFRGFFAAALTVALAQGTLAGDPNVQISFEEAPFLDVLGANDELAEEIVDVDYIEESASPDGESFNPLAEGAAPAELSSVKIFRWDLEWNPRGAFHDFLEETQDGFWIAGAEASFLHIKARTGGTITASFSDTTAPGVASQSYRVGEAHLDNGVAPRLWVGRQITPKWAIVGRYWSLNDSKIATPTPLTSTGSNFATFQETTSFQGYTIDIEAVRSVELGQWKIDGYVGGRTLNFDTGATLLGFGVFTTGNFINLTLQNHSQFNGTGVTFGMTARRRIGELPLYVFASGRGSHLDGQTFSMGRSDGTVASSPSAPLVGAATVTRIDQQATATVGELQTGMQLDYELAEHQASVFVRMAFEYQHWTINAAPTGGAGFGGTIGELTTNSFASAGIGDLQLLGIAVSTGINW